MRPAATPEAPPRELWEMLIGPRALTLAPKGDAKDPLMTGIWTSTPSFSFPAVPVSFGALVRCCSMQRKVLFPVKEAAFCG